MKNIVNITYIKFLIKKYKKNKINININLIFKKNDYIII
jgi:hypothetical protein